MLDFPNLVLYAFFAAVNRQRFTMWATIPTGIIVTIFNYFLIPRYGILAASISLVFAEIIVFSAGIFYARHLDVEFSLSRMFWKPILACLPMVTVIYLLLNFSVFLQVACAVVTYAVSFYIFKGIHKEDRVILERVLPPSIRQIVMKNV